MSADNFTERETEIILEMHKKCEILPITNCKEELVINDEAQKNLLLKAKCPSTCDDDEDDQGDDRGWAWMVLTASFMISALLWGQVISFNVYFAVIRDLYQTSRATVAWIGSLNQAMVNLTAITSGYYLSKLGARGSTLVGGIIASLGYIASYYSNSVLDFYFTYGIVVGFGFSLSFSGCMAAIGEYFKRHLFVATSLCLTGGGVGIVCFGNLLEYLSDVYGWRGSLLLQSAITLNICVFGATFFRRRKPSIANASQLSKLRTMTVRQRITDIRILLLMFTGFLGGLGLMSALVVYKDLTVSKGFVESYEQTLTALGGGNIVGRLATGFIMRHTQPLMYFVVAQTACSLTLFLLSVVKLPILFVVLSGFIGYGQGNFISAMPNIVSYIFGRQEMAVTYGYILFSTGIGLLFGGPMGGLIADYTGSYSIYLAVCGCILLLSTILTILLYFHHEKVATKSRVKTKH